MLDNLPHDQAFSQLIITQMVTYAEKCNDWYKALVSRGQPTASGRRLRAPAAFAESGEIEEVVSSLFKTDSELNTDLLEKEISLLIDEVEKDVIDEADLIRDKKTITGLCMLSNSMKWLATKISQLRFISDRATDSSRHEPGNHRHTRRWTLLTSSEPRQEGIAVYLPLNRETASEFDAVVGSYNGLSTTILRTLHLSIRTQVLFSLSHSISTTYTLDSLLNDPDPSIITLNNALVAFDTLVSTSIPISQLPHITSGLSPLMDAYLLLLSSRITSLNDNGCALMQLNILVLQQNLKNIEDGASLPYSALFFDLFTAGPDAVIARAREHGKDFGVPGGRFGAEVVKRLVELTYGEKLASQRRDVGVAARRGMEGHLLEVSEYMY
jgi:exocyst complex component 4